MSRRTPYTERGITRVPCARCGKPSRYQWSCCANDNRYVALCPSCDVGLNEVAMRYVYGRKAEPKLQQYRRNVIPTNKDWMLP
jgi:hypothetical protein